MDEKFIKHGLCFDAGFVEYNCGSKDLKSRLDIIQAMTEELWSVYPEAQLESTTKFRKFYLLRVSLEILMFVNKSTLMSYLYCVAVGNVVGDSPACKGYSLSQGALVPLLSKFSKHSEESMLRTAMWTLSNLCRGDPAISFEKDIIEVVIEDGVCLRLVNLLFHLSPTIHTPSLRNIGNIVTGNDEQTQVIIEGSYCYNLIWETRVQLIIWESYISYVKKLARDKKKDGIASFNLDGILFNDYCYTKPLKTTLSTLVKAEGASEIFLMSVFDKQLPEIVSLVLLRKYAMKLVIYGWIVDYIMSLCPAAAK
ncbi:hypothetical protein C5167_026279 [Papaver somniferum]|nr:hypothetical protein C5167_026279 [Papaver somniferum]